jgi:mevalonate kinase
LRYAILRKTRVASRRSAVEAAMANNNRFFDAIDRRFDELRNMFEDWDFTFLHKRMNAVDTLTKKADACDRLQRLAY